MKRKSGGNAQIDLKMAGAGWRGSPALRHDYPRHCSEPRSHKKCSPQTFMAPQAAKKLSVRLNTCLNTSFLVSTPADQHPRLNTWFLNAESCLNVEPKALARRQS